MTARQWGQFKNGWLAAWRLRDYTNALDGLRIFSAWDRSLGGWVYYAR